MGGNVSLGFAQSFAATYFCRMCLCSKAETKVLSVDQPNKYRTSSNYQEAIDIIKNSSEVDLKETKGVMEYCVLNDLDYFHTLENWTADIMHDSCEGIQCVSVKAFFEIGMKHKIFTEREIKNLVSNYHGWGTLNSQFIPSDIKLTSKNLNQSASQMKCIMQHFPFIFHAYKDHPKLQTAWKCINSMLKILQICYSNVVTEQDLEKLKSFVKCHLDNIKELEIELKPKHHFHTHYPEIFRRSGPLCHMSTLRFEMKHKSLTNTMKNNNNFKCVTKTMTEKYLHKNAFQEVYIDKIQHTKLRKIEQDFLESHTYSLSRFSSSLIQSTKNVHFNSDFYEKGLILQHEKDYFEIENILNIENSFYFVCRKYERIRYDDFFVSLELKSFLPEEFTLIKHSDLILKKTHDKKRIGDQIYILCESLNIK